METIRLLFIGIVLFVVSPFTQGNSIHDRSVETVRVGDNVSKIYSMFKKKFRVTETKQSGASRSIAVSDNSKPVVRFQATDNGQIIHILVLSRYSMPEGIGPGSRLSEALQVYKNARITPVDSGYLLTFEGMNGVGFRLDQTSLPKALRDIPDDVLTDEQVKRILSYGDTKILAIELF